MDQTILYQKLPCITVHLLKFCLVSPHYTSPLLIKKWTWGVICEEVTSAPVLFLVCGLFDIMISSRNGLFRVLLKTWDTSQSGSSKWRLLKSKSFYLRWWWLFPVKINQGVGLKTLLSPFMKAEIVPFFVATWPSGISQVEVWRRF